MYNRYSNTVKSHAIELRKQGYSVSEISTVCVVPFGTAYSWVCAVALNQSAQERIKMRRQIGIEHTKAWWKERKSVWQKQALVEAVRSTSVIKFTRDLARVYCALLFWAEGAKRLSKVGFMNSDPNMVRFFLRLLRTGFDIDESKLRVLLHLHNYHNEAEMRHFWSGITNIPLTQFTKTYIKSHTKKRVHEGYKGSCSLSYYDARIARVLTAIYNTFAADA